MRDEVVAKALEHVDRHGDVEGQPPHHPAAVAMRKHIVGANLAMFDDERQRYVLTSSGRQSIVRRRSPAVSCEVMDFRRAHPRKRGR